MNTLSRTDLSRRDFIKSAAAAGVTAAFGFPAILRAADKAGAKPLILGQGAYTYQWVANWARLPAGKKFGNTHSVIESQDGRIFIHNASPTGDATCIFDPSGKFIKSWGEQFAEGAHGMDYRREGKDEFLYLAPTRMDKVFKTTLDGEVVLELDYPKLATNDKGEPCYVESDVTKKKAGKSTTTHMTAAQRYVPTFIALAPNGDFYVTDGYGANYVHRYTLKGDNVQTWGGPGDEPGKFKCPHGIWCDTRDAQNPVILVADRANSRLQTFTLDGKLIKIDKGDVRAPCHFDQRGTDLVIPDLKGRVTLVDKNNKLITHLGDNPDQSQWARNAVPQSDTRPGVLHASRGALRFQGKHFRRRMAAVRPGDETSVRRRLIEPLTQFCLQTDCNR